MLTEVVQMSYVGRKRVAANVLGRSHCDPTLQRLSYTIVSKRGFPRRRGLARDMIP